jgi:hypothetical protein
MTFGDLLEALGLGSAAAAAYLQWGTAATLAVVAVSLIYEGQCFGSTNMPKPRRPRWLKRPKWLHRPTKTTE